MTTAPGNHPLSPAGVSTMVNFPSADLQPPVHRISTIDNFCKYVYDEMLNRGYRCEGGNIVKIAGIDAFGVTGNKQSAFTWEEILQNRQAMEIILNYASEMREMAMEDYADDAAR